MYLKVPHKKHGNLVKDATVEEVENALKSIAPNIGLTVDMDLNYPCVEFPAGTSYQEYQRVEKALNDAGFEAY